MGFVIESYANITVPAWGWCIDAAETEQQAIIFHGLGKNRMSRTFCRERPSIIQSDCWQSSAM